MTPTELLYSTLEAQGLPVYLQGSMADDESYPEQFITYQNLATDGGMYYDNQEGAVVWSYNVAVYATRPDVAQSTLMKIRDELRALDFVASGAGHDMISDEPTHTGRGLDVLYVERTATDE